MHRADRPTRPSLALRDILCTCGVALIGVVLLRWTAFAVARIPSPSMQPTLLGNDEAGVHDRVLVDRVRYLWQEPQRWDLLAFHFPLQPRVEVSKRCVGLPGESMRIAGGNVYRLQASPAGEVLDVLRKPDWLQQEQWKEIYPARRLVRGETSLLDGSFRGEPDHAFAAEGEGLRLQLEAGATARLLYADRDGGLVDRLWDGYPLAMAKVLRQGYAERALLGEIVTDAKFTVRLHGASAVAALRFSLRVLRPGLPELGYAMECSGGRGSLVVRGAEGARLGGSVAFACALADGVELAFAHVDDELVAWRDGVELQRWDCGAFACRDGCELPDPCGMGPALPTPDHCVEAAIELQGAGEVRLDQLRLWRDLQYTRGGLAPGVTVVVPPDSYFVLGDNPLQSSDSRDWTAASFRTDADGRLVRDGEVAAQVLRGCLQPATATSAPGADENPLPLDPPSLGAGERMLFTDLFGERHMLRPEVSFAREDGRWQMHFGDEEVPGSTWPLHTEAVRFVPRDHILGRAIFAVWPVPPFGPWRPGWLR